MEPLSQIVQVLNERFGMELGEADQLLFDQFEQEWVADSELAAQARENTKENFGLVFERKFIDTIVKRMDSNEVIFKRILDDEEFRRTLGDFYLLRVYERLREAGKEPLDRARRSIRTTSETHARRELVRETLLA